MEYTGGVLFDHLFPFSPQRFDSPRSLSLDSPPFEVSIFADSTNPIYG